jgi:hypothetical protein
MLLKIKTISFQYDDQESFEFKSPDEAIKFFDGKGWGFHGFVIRVNFEFNLSMQINEEELITLRDNWFNY